MPLAAAKRESSLAVSSRHGEQTLARVRHDRGEHHERERETAGENALLQPAELNKEQHTDETEEDGRDTRERFGGEADEPHDAGIFRVFGDVHRRAGAERQRRAHGDENEIERVADVGEDAGRSGEIARRRREERPAQLRQTALYNDPDQEEKNTACYHRRGDKGCFQKNFPELSHALALLSLRSRSAALMRRMKRNSTRPTEKSASRCREP